MYNNSAVNAVVMLQLRVTKIWALLDVTAVMDDVAVYMYKDRGISQCHMINTVVNSH